jgi:SAM-dependent methyltransferase
MDREADRDRRHLTLEAGELPGNLEGELDRLYANRFSEPERAAKARLWRTLCDAHFSRLVPAQGTVLDVGAGYCDFINNVRAARRIAVDLNPDMPRYAAEGVETHLMPLEQLGEAIKPGTVDLAFASNVFEHLRGPDALLLVLSAVRTALRPGGRLVIMQPNVRLVGGHFWDFFDHTLPLTEKGMEEALTMAGYEVVERRARFLPYTTKSRLPQWPWLVRLYLALPAAQWLMGKQMLIVARRPQ